MDNIAGRTALLLGALTLGIGIGCGTALAETLPLPPALIAFNSPEGEQLLLSSNARGDFWDLSQQFTTQINPAYCGVATQENFFDNRSARQVLSPDIVMRQGITLDELGRLLGSYSVMAPVFHAVTSSLNEFRRVAVENLAQRGNFVLVNYICSAIRQEQGGISRRSPPTISTAIAFWFWM